MTSPNVTINNPDLVVAGGSAFGPVITASAMGGTGNFTYSFENLPFQNENEYEVLLNGTYEVVVMDENGCTDTTQVVVNKPEELFLTILPPACFDSLDGEILIDGVGGGYAPYQFALNDGPLTSEVVYEWRWCWRLCFAGEWIRLATNGLLLRSRWMHLPDCRGHKCGGQSLDIKWQWRNGRPAVLYRWRPNFSE
ncbi:MAG: SprB repeat-containing protein [Saprospiraceae bacterium]